MLTPTKKIDITNPSGGSILKSSNELRAQSRPSLLKSSSLLNLSEPGEVLQSISLNFTFNFLKSKVPSINVIIYENIKPFLMNLETPSIANINKLATFGEKQQEDITQTSALIMKFNNIKTINTILALVKHESVKTTIFSTKLILPINDVISNISFGASNVQELLTNDLSKTTKLINDLNRDISELEIYKSVLMLIKDECISNNLFSQDELARIDVFSKRVISISNSLMVGTNIRLSLQTISDSIIRELEICNNIINVALPAIVAVKLNNSTLAEAKILELLK